MRSVSDRFDNYNEQLLVLNHQEMDMSCPKLPQEGKNFWSQSCVEKTEENGARITAKCPTGARIRKIYGRPPVEIKKVFVCRCKATVSPDAKAWIKYEYKQPTCYACIKEDLAVAREEEKAEKKRLKAEKEKQKKIAALKAKLSKLETN